MKNKTPRGKTPSLIGASNGKPERVSVKRRCKCTRCGNSIQAGDNCFGIPQNRMGFKSIKRYCENCFQNILTQTHKDLEELKNL